MSSRFHYTLIFWLAILLLGCSGSRKADQYFSRAQQSVQNQSYERAEQYYQKAIQQDSANAEIWRSYGRFQLMRDEKQNAISAFEKYLAIDSSPDFRHYALIGNLYRDLGELEQAVQAYEQFLDLGPSGAPERAEVEKERARLIRLQEAMKHPTAYDMRSLPPAINTNAEEYLPLLPADQSFLMFTRRERRTEDFYLSEKVKGQWMPAQPVHAINSPRSEGAGTLSADGKTLIFTRCQSREGLGECDLYLSRMEKDGWSEPVNMGPRVNTEYNETQPCLSPDGRSLYFVSNRPGGYGGHDIWKIEWLREGKWGDAQPLDSVVNSKWDDETPFIHFDHQTLYFTSKRPGGFGGRDLYLSRKKEGQWQEVQNMGYPVNSQRDEGTIHVTTDGKTGYVGRIPEGKRDYDLFRFRLAESVAARPATYIRGRVVSEETGQGLKATLEVRSANGEQLIADIESNADGSFLIALSRSASYQFYASAPGYAYRSDQFTFLPDSSEGPKEDWLIELPPLEGKDKKEAAPIVLENLKFEFGKAEWLPESEAELEKLLRMMQTHPGLRIEIRGHTDNVGSAQANQVLSLQRARAVKDYLVSKGISEDRIEYEGYGEGQPLVPNDTEAQRQKNRRTEFVILGGVE